MTSGLVFPGAAEAAEAQAFEFVHLQMKVLDRSAKRFAFVVVAFDGENRPAQRHLGDAQNKRVGEIAAADQNIRLQFPVELDVLFVGNDQGSHGKRPRTFLASCTRLTPTLIAASRIEIFCLRLKFKICVQEVSRMRNSLSTTSVSPQKKLCRSWTHSK